MNKIKNIEIYRFLFALVICYMHMMMNWANLYKTDDLFNHCKHITAGGFCVEFFFIIAGYFLYFSIQRSDNVLDLVIKKIKRLFPVLLFSLMFICILKIFFYKVVFKWSELAYDLIFLQSTALPVTKGINVAAWYVSALVFVSAFYALIVKSLNKRQGLFAILICSFLGLSALAKANGAVTDLVNFYLTIGTLRGITYMGIGYLTAEFLQRKGDSIKEFLNSNWFTKTLTTIFEISATGLIFYFVTVGKNLTSARTLIAFTFVFLFICLILRAGLLSRILDNNISAFLGKYAYSIYLMQAVFNIIARKTLWKDYTFMSEHFALALLLNIACYIILGVVTYHLVEKPPEKLKAIAVKLIQKKG